MCPLPKLTLHFGVAPPRCLLPSLLGLAPTLPCLRLFLDPGPLHALLSRSRRLQRPAPDSCLTGFLSLFQALLRITQSETTFSPTT